MWQILVSLAVCNVPIKYSGNGPGKQIISTSATIRGKIHFEDTVYIATSDLEDGGFLRRGSQLEEHAVAYFGGRNAYSIGVSPTSTYSMVSMIAFNPDGVTLTKDSLEFGDVRLHNVEGRFLNGSCTNAASLETCEFIAINQLTQKNITFFISVDNIHNELLAEDLSDGLVLEGNMGTVTITTEEYNTYEVVPTKRVLSLKQLGMFLHQNRYGFSIWHEMDTATPTKLLSLAIVLIGGILFVPNSVDITAAARRRPQPEHAMIMLLGGAHNIMHVVVADFAITSLTIVLFLVYNNGLGKGTFRTARVIQTPPYIDVLLSANTALCTIAVTWCVVVCAAYVEHHLATKTDTGLKRRPFFRWLKKFIERPFIALTGNTATAATVSHVVLARMCFEYVLIVALMAACPEALGFGFIQFIYIASACSMCFVVGRDMALIAFTSGILAPTLNGTPPSTAIKVLSMAAFAAMLLGPLVERGIIPLIEDSNSFPSTAIVTNSVAFASAVVITSLGWEIGTFPAQSKRHQN
jgi:hypothetical protein